MVRLTGPRWLSLCVALSLSGCVSVYDSCETQSLSQSVTVPSANDFANFFRSGFSEFSAHFFARSDHSVTLRGHLSAKKREQNTGFEYTRSQGVRAPHMATRCPFDFVQAPLRALISSTRSAFSRASPTQCRGRHGILVRGEGRGGGRRALQPAGRRVVSGQAHSSAGLPRTTQTPGVGQRLPRMDTREAAPASSRPLRTTRAS